MRKKEFFDGDPTEETPKNDDLERALEELSALSENGGVTISGRIYRITSPADERGRQTTELVGKVDQFVDEDYVGRNFGGGRYKVRYRVNGPDDSKAVEKNFIFNVGSEYDKYVKVSSTKGPARAPEVDSTQQTRAGFLDNFIGGLTAEKITAVGVAIKALKELFAPPPSPDWPQIVALLSARSEPKPALSDTIVLSAMDSLKQQNKQPSLLQQIRDLKTIKDELKDDLDQDKDESENGENMNFILKTAMEYLPLLLQKNNGNFEAAGAAAAQNPYVQNLVSSDPELAQMFFEKAKQKYGLADAQKLAVGFGYDLTEKENIENEH